MNLRPIKACHACGASYTFTTWRLLPVPAAPPPPGIDSRRCVCGEILSCDLLAAAEIANALPETEHTASRAEPPPAALESSGPTCEQLEIIIPDVALAVLEALTDALEALAEEMRRSNDGAKNGQA